MLQQLISKKALTAVMLFMAAVFLFGQKADALTLSPARLELSGDPGSTISGEFLVINEQQGENTFYTTAENFEASGETGTPSFNSKPGDLASWITVESQLTLSRGGQQKVPFTVVIPKDAEAGGHFAAIFLNTTPPNVASGEVAVGAKVGILVLLHVSGEIKEGGGVSDFGTLENKSFFTSLPITFSYRFSNSGNDRVGPYGDLAVHNMIGMTASKLDPNASQGNVLPNSTRRFEVRWGPEEAAPEGFLNAAAFEMQHFAFGMYRAHLNLSYGNGGEASAVKTIFVLPWQLLIIAIMVIGVALLIIIFFLKRYNKWIIRRAKEQNNIS